MLCSVRAAFRHRLHLVECFLLYQGVNFLETVYTIILVCNTKLHD